MGVDVEVCMVSSFFFLVVLCFPLPSFAAFTRSVNESAYVIELPGKICVGVQDLSSLLQPVPEVICPKDTITGLINSNKVIYRSEDGDNYIEISVQEIQVMIAGKPAILNIARELNIKVPKK